MAVNSGRITPDEAFDQLEGSSSLTATLLERKARMCITNLSTGLTFEAQFNPTEFSENIEVNYSRHTVPGLSHQVMQYVNTNNETFEMELFFVADTREQAIRNLANRRLLSSYCYPKRQQDALIGGGPPRLLFVYPTFISLTCVMVSVSFTYQRFSPSGIPIQFTAGITLEEMRNVRLLSEDVTNQGTLRAGLQETALEDIILENELE